MPNRNYITGRRFEYKVRDEWRARGYTALRSAGSHSPYDVIALKPNEADTSLAPSWSRVINGVEYTEYVTPVIGYAIQCKRRKVSK